MNVINRNTKKIFLITSFVIGNLYIFIFTNLFFNSTFGADYERYINYLEYFFTANNNTGLDQGSLYFFLISVAINLHNDFLNLSNLQSSLSFSIQLVNTLLVFFGSYFYYRYFKFIKFDEVKILLILNIVNFFPPLLALRITMKPEILVYALVPILLLHIEQFKNAKQLPNLFLGFLALALIISTKGTFFAMIPIFLFFLYRDFIKELGSKAIFLLVLLFSIIATPVFIENYIKNENSILSRASYEKYDNKASLNILYKNPLGKSRQINGHSVDENTLIGITLLDTFSDHFNFYWDKDVSLFNKHRKNIILASESEELISFDFKNRFIFFNGPFKDNVALLRTYTSYLFTLLLFIFIFLFSYSDKKNKVFYLCPFIGMAILYINSLGIPENNFDPFTSDTFKVFYYSPLLILSFFYCLFFLVNKRFFVFFSIIFIFLNLYIVGFPKQDSSQYYSELENLNSISVLCEINKLIIYDIDNKSNCIDQEREICLNYSENAKSNDISAFMLNKYKVNNADKCVVSKSHIFSNNLFKKAPYTNLIYFLIVLTWSARLRFND